MGVRRKKRDRGSDPVLALAAADELFRQGRSVEAIDLLTAANRRGRDLRLEQRLVAMRFEAFRREDWSGAAGDVPEVVADLFPGAVIPEIDRADMTVDLVRSGVERHGCLIVRGLVAPHRVAQLVADIDQALDGFDSCRFRPALTPAPPWYVPFSPERDQEQARIERNFRRDGGGVLAVDSPPGLFDVIETFEEAGVRRVVGEVLGERPALLAKKWTLRRVAHDSPESSWHQDGAFMGRDIRSLNVWLALSHCGDDAPGLDVVARRLDSIVPTGSHGAWLNWTVGPGMVEQVAQGSVVRPIFEPGDALIFDHLNLHRTAVEPGMTRDRYAIEAWFLAPSTYESMMAGAGEAGAPPRDQLPMLY